jgi:hypothetical protein
LIEAHHQISKDARQEDHGHNGNEDPHAKDPRNAALLRTVEGVNECCGLNSHQAPWQRIRAEARGSVGVADTTIG